MFLRRSPQKPKRKTEAPEKRRARSNGKHAGGRPPKYHDGIPEITRRLAELPLTDDDIARFLRIPPRTFYKWKVEYPEFRQAVTRTKEQIDDLMESSLYRQGTGYDIESVKVFMHEGKPVYAPYIEHIPGDPGAAKNWLANRRPDRWRDRIEIRDITPPDPNAEANRLKAIAFFTKVIEERARAGLPSIFEDESRSKPAVTIEAPKRTGGNGHGGNGANGSG